MNKLIALLFFILLPGCKEKTIHLSKKITFDKEMDISYGNDPEQKLDLYIPKNTQQHRDVFLIIHGGGWRAGDKSHLTSFTISMMQKFPKSVFANINYRLASENRFGIPNQTDDVEKVILFLEKKLKYRTTFILLGNSAGGHLSMLYAYQSDKARKVKAVVNIVGPSDLSDPDFKNYSDYSFVKNHLVDSSVVSKSISMEIFASPIYWINKNSPPTLSFYGNQDSVIPLSQKGILDSALHKNKILNESFEFSGGHLDWTNEKNTPFLIGKINQFLKQIQ